MKSVISVLLFVIGIVLVVGGNIEKNNNMLYASAIIGIIWMFTAIPSEKDK